MQTIENQKDTGITITLDEKHFVNCHFTNCKLIYSGGDYAWTDTKFESCQVTLAGAAQRTANLLGNFGMMKPPDVPPDVPFDPTKRNPKPPSGVN
jgi:hypothetical protein